MALEGFFLALTLNLFAEIADKTQLLLIVLSAKHTKHLLVYGSAMLGIAVATSISVFVGSLLGNFISKNLLQTVAGLAFIAFGIHSFFAKEEKEIKENYFSFISVFMLVFFSEISADKSQLANLLLATQYNLVEVFAGGMLGMMLIGISSVLIGSKIAEKLDTQKIKHLSAAVFILFGLYFLSSLLFQK